MGNTLNNIIVHVCTCYRSNSSSCFKFTAADMTAARKGIAKLLLESTLSDKPQKVAIKENRIRHRQRSEFYDFIDQKNVDD